ncbi:hypothetical protein [Paenibacillus sp. YAF4_2]|uniref:hypothetical protein n=1 Tax=Paenibacillus sp. YAF4_2 TaxID=3233085 RepID=UPI003F9E45E8
METIRSVKAIISWDRDPTKYELNIWLRDLIVHFGIIEGRQLMGDAWTVSVRVTGFIEGTWDTYADVGFIVDEAPWHELVSGYTFRLWAGKEIATVKIL